MAETTLSHEQLAAMSKCKAVENYGPRGYTTTGDDTLLDCVLRPGHVETRLQFAKSQTRAEVGFTHLALVPLSSDAIDKRKGLPQGVGIGNIAVCIAYQGYNTDKFGRNSVLRAVVVMAQADAENFVSGVQQSPGLVYDLLRQANGRSVTKFDGTPADIRPGKSVETLANTKVGGHQQMPINSAPFPVGFTPNPLF